MRFAPLAIVYKLLHQLIRVYWFVFRPQIYGVRCLIRYGDQFLLIRHTYGDKRWTLPGGGLKRRETPEAAMRREVREEVGIALSGPVGLGEYTSTEGYQRDTVYCYFGEVARPDLKIARNEIQEAAWFERSLLPKHLSNDAKRVLQLYDSR